MDKKLSDPQEKIFKLKLKLNDMQSNRNTYRAIVWGFIIVELLKIFKVI
jgi:hypothetical protein